MHDSSLRQPGCPGPRTRGFASPDCSGFARSETAPWSNATGMPRFRPRSASSRSSCPTAARPLALPFWNWGFGLGMRHPPKRAFAGKAVGLDHPTYCPEDRRTARNPLLARALGKDLDHLGSGRPFSMPTGAEELCRTASKRRKYQKRAAGRRERRETRNPPPESHLWLIRRRPTKIAVDRYGTVTPEEFLARESSPEG
jgi:hypothetical protein